MCAPAADVIWRSTDRDKRACSLKQYRPVLACVWVAERWEDDPWVPLPRDAGGNSSARLSRTRHAIKLPRGTPIYSHQPGRPAHKLHRAASPAATRFNPPQPAIYPVVRRADAIWRAIGQLLAARARPGQRRQLAGPHSTPPRPRPLAAQAGAGGPPATRRINLPASPRRPGTRHAKLENNRASVMESRAVWRVRPGPCRLASDRIRPTAGPPAPAGVQIYRPAPVADGWPGRTGIFFRTVE